MARVHNFGAGPAALPLPVLEKAQAELLDFNGNGMSLMEMSHRSRGFAEVIEAAQANVRKLMDVPDDYAVLFLQGGASLQFAMIPMNLRGEGQTADYVDTGSWSTKAIKEARTAGKVNVAWDGKKENYLRAPKESELDLTGESAAYVHICSNETIGGVRYPTFPKTAAPLIADMSSEIMSRVVDIRQFAMVYAGAQKNLGPSGLAVVVLRKDLAGRCPESVPIYLRYGTHIEKDSLYHTPNTWGIYIVKLVTDWIAEQGGVAAVERVNEIKAKLLYDTLDASDFYKACADKECRSTMNVTWRLPNEDLEATFVKEATAAGLAGLKGHRSVGGIRASIYNACPRDAVEALVAFMKDFEASNG
jgi:phosphoserine aminotransferase